MANPGLPPWLSGDLLVAPVRALLSNDAAIPDRWEGHRLTGGVGEALGVWRLGGTARVGDTHRPWSLILKGLAPPAPGSPPDGLYWPLRERDLYASDVLRDLPGGIAAPTCYGEVQRPDGSAWLWLEDLAAGPHAPWPLHRFTAVARQLGQFNGAWLDGRPLPGHPSLSRDWIRHRVEASAPYIDLLQDPAAHPLVRGLYPPRVAAAYTRLWHDRERQLAALTQVPHTFCHLDVFPRNAFLRTAADGRAETVLIDWAFAGIAPLGADLTSLVVASVLFMEAPLAEARALEAAVLESYIAGLRDTGWRGDPATVREAYRIAARLRFGVGGIHRLIPYATSDMAGALTSDIFNRPGAEVLVNSRGVQEWMADLCDEA